MLARQTQMKKIRINPKSQLSSGDHNVLPKFLAFSPKFKKKILIAKAKLFSKAKFFDMIFTIENNMPYT